MKFILGGFVFVVLLIFVVGFSVYFVQTRKSMNKKVLFVLMPENYQDFEFNVPYKVLVDKGFLVDVAGLKPGVATGKLGGTFSPNKLLSDMSEQDFDGYVALIIPGGPGSTQYLWDNEKLQEVIRYFNSKGKIVASICHAVVAPVQAGILKGKRATVYPSDEAKDILKACGVEFVDEGCVTLEDEKIVTAQGPDFAQDFTEEIIKLLE